MQYVVVGTDGQRPAHRRHPRARQADDARLRDHREPGRRPRPARDLRPRAAMSGARTLPVPVESRLRRTRRVCSPRRDEWRCDMRWCEVDLCYVYHPLNAYDLPDGRVVVRRRPPPEDVRHRPQRSERRARRRLVRWTIDPAAGRVHEERARRPRSGVPAPRRAAASAVRNRYGYTAAFGDGVEHGPAVEARPRRGTTEVHDYGPGSRDARTGLRPTGRRRGRGRRLDHVVRLRREHRLERRRHPERAGLHG